MSIEDISPVSLSGAGVLEVVDTGVLLVVDVDVLAKLGAFPPSIAICCGVSATGAGRVADGVDVEVDVFLADGMANDADTKKASDKYLSTVECIDF